MDGSVPFEQVYVQYVDRVHRFLMVLVRDTAVAEDLANDTFEKAFVAYDRVRPEPGRVLVWLFSIARNSAIDELRRRRRWRILFDRAGPELAGRAADPERAAEMRAGVAEIMAAVSTLKPSDQELLALRLGGEMTHDEMARVLSKRDHTVAVATRRAVDRLRSALAAAGLPEGDRA